jgi:F420-0:gamma-glutamyl ligase
MAESAPHYPASSQWTRQDVDDLAYLRLAVRTRWLRQGDDLVEVLREYLPPLILGDTVVVSEKVAILLTGRALPVTAARPGRLARILARWVRPPEGSYGLSVPEKMQYVCQSVSRSRLLLAAAVAAITRPFGIHGVFYRLAGPVARDVDGALPPYEDLLFPPMSSETANSVSTWLEREIGVGVAIVDLNDFGGRVRGVSPRALPAAVLARVLADNPLRQRLTGTPFGVVRPLVQMGSAAASQQTNRVA